MFKWLRGLWKSPPSAPRSYVLFDEEVVRFHCHDGILEEVTWDELSSVEIVTTDAGPFVCDVFYVLHGDQRGCVIPQEAEGAKELLERLQTLPCFNNQAATDAMSCASNARFPVWQREHVS